MVSQLEEGRSTVPPKTRRPPWPTPMVILFQQFWTHPSEERNPCSVRTGSHWQATGGKTQQLRPLAAAGTGAVLTGAATLPLWRKGGRAGSPDRADPCSYLLPKREEQGCRNRQVNRSARGQLHSSAQSAQRQKRSTVGILP